MLVFLHVFARSYSYLWSILIFMHISCVAIVCVHVHIMCYNCVCVSACVCVCVCVCSFKHQVMMQFTAVNLMSKATADSKSEMQSLVQEVAPRWLCCGNIVNGTIRQSCLHSFIQTSQHRCRNLGQTNEGNWFMSIERRHSLAFSQYYPVHVTTWKCHDCCNKEQLLSIVHHVQSPVHRVQHLLVDPNE